MHTVILWKRPGLKSLNSENVHFIDALSGKLVPFRVINGVATFGGTGVTTKE